VCIHIGSGAGMAFTSMEAPVDVMITVQPINIVTCAADLLWSRVLRMYPNLKFALSEGGTGWIPYWLERIDYTYQQHRFWTHQDFGDQLPSQVARDHFTFCFISDRTGVEEREAIGIDNITWECDYPHSDSSWPNSPESVTKQLAGVPDVDVNKITHGNAMRIFRYDPFSRRSKEQSTTAALRAEVTD
jgi:predicted TIM-barrel fold metal-dependent hydrolase